LNSDFEQGKASKKMAKHGEKILLALLPFWDPQIPPMGLACIKSPLKKQGREVTAVDANVEKRFRNIYDRYFGALKEYIPVNNRGNLYKIGHEVFRNHMMAHINHLDKKEYLDLVKILVFKTFYWEPDPSQVMELVQVIEDFYSRLEDYFLGLLEKEKPTVVGLSVFGGTLAASLFAFRLTRLRFPGIKTVMGGGIFSDQLAAGSPDFSSFLDATGDYIDKIVIGEGEILFPMLLQNELPESQRVYTVKDAGGRYLDLVSAQIPDFSDFDLQHYFALSIYGSRSCPFQCSFCSEATFWGTYRKKDPRQAAAELAHLSQKYKSQLFLMGDCLLNPIITDLSKALANVEVPVYWDGYLRVDKQVCDEEQTLLWRRSGFYRARIGCESASPRVLGLMGKKITPQQIKTAVSSLARAGIKTTTMWVIGHPGESEEDFQHTLDFLEELKDDIYEADCTPFYFWPNSQPGFDNWQKEHECVSLYPENARDMLLVRTWIMNGEPSREELYRRVNRFSRHCRKLGIPNPYSLHDVHEADQRWLKLQRNAAPPLLEFKKDTPVDECKSIHKLYLAEKKDVRNVDFGF
jgi:radical SAM superfamily enzyme YgiQ (UPF0313 family)